MVTKEQLSSEKYQELEQYINELPDIKGELITVLHKAQKIFGYLPKEVQYFVGRKMGIPTAKVFGVVSFYSYFSMEPKGKHHVAVCMGTACYVRGAEKVLNEFKNLLGIDVGKTTEDGKFSIEGLRCVGACGLAPVVLVGEKVYGRVTPEMVKDIIAEYN
ncbi:NADH-quinone oxidoreductase subunit E/NADP-reducing hydrogenase subunit HndA [Natranaerovirga hydrolytica]|uniref:NADH-quinone oxidoreductase subunit E/NADP-reducing hydrogenase subunit HndA n=1 Tax=Natranaerovirga hydrolytica TaxID=680378 RepID=A0A4R1M7P8_9FIRM|nr:NAD(P)H-dependent oxidoreductase subunit E [Natranaerovirga hydrolytica]TCK87955.1 NADH-quinone oxidoreductase subunit E/NADP-reducing hydrogenase subunit HndA [Natranaerovirga hydrolytica]